MSARRAGAVTAAVGALLLLATFPVAAAAMPLAAPLEFAHARIPHRDRAVVRVVAAGDIACDPTNTLYNRGRGVGGWCRAEATAKLIERLEPDAVLALGDEQYDTGRLSDFRKSYASTWGAHKYRTFAVPGNHEYYSSGRARGFFTYFGRHAGPKDRGWYTKQLGAWRLIGLNTNCGVVGCRQHSRQYAWLAKTLAETPPSVCTVAMMHHPLVSSGPHGDDESGARPLWKLLYRAGVDVALTSHDHIYERFAPVDASGAKDPVTGIREFVVGTGGAQHYGIRRVHAFSQRRNTKTFGVLALSLASSGYAWRFRPIAGSTFTDQGSGSCHGAPA